MTRVAKETALAPMMMKSLRWIPYNIHNVTPALNWMRVSPLTSLAEWVFHILMLCGTNPNMVNEAASTPRTIHTMRVPVLVLSGSPAPDKRRHLGRHDGHELYVCIQRQAGHIDHGAGNMLDIHDRLNR